MDAKLINPFVSAAIQVLQGELSEKVERGALRLESSPLTGDEVTVLVGLAGDVKGVVMLSMSTKTVLTMASRMAGEELTVMDELSKSAIAELTNVVSGRATAELEKLGFGCNISAPTVITGVGTEISTANVHRLVVPLHTPLGDLTLHVAVRTD